MFLLYYNAVTERVLGSTLDLAFVDFAALPMRSSHSVCEAADSRTGILLQRNGRSLGEMPTLRGQEERGGRFGRRAPVFMGADTATRSKTRHPAGVRSARPRSGKSEAVDIDSDRRIGASEMWAAGAMRSRVAAESGRVWGEAGTA